MNTATETAAIESPLCCPRCHGEIKPDGAGVACASCGAKFRRDGRVIQFIEDDGFYEGAYLAQVGTESDGRLLGELRFYLVNTHYLWWVRKWIPAAGRLLELGCGGGVRFFAKHARVTGLDLSRTSLARVDSKYEHALQADALRLPLRDESYDGVVSSYFFEHILLAEKDALLAELRRVLKPGGRVVFLFDVESQNPLFRWLRKDEARYRAAIIENDRHYGLEAASAALARFERAGFNVLAYHAANKTPVQHAPVYAWMRHYESSLANTLTWVGGVVSEQPILAKVYTASVTLLDDAVEPLFPLDWSRILLVALERS